MDTWTHYSALGCDQNASKQELRNQYKKLALKTHPDKSDSSTSSHEFHQIDVAIKTLSDDTTRRQYDSQLIEKRSENRIINEDIILSDLTLDSETKTYWYGCRCGGAYRLNASDSPTDSLNALKPMVLDCDSCSLSVRLKRS